MRLEDLKNRRLGMPDEMKQMVADTIRAQCAEGRPKRRRLRHAGVIAAAAVLAVGTSVFAAYQNARLRAEKTAPYAAKITTEVESAAADGSSMSVAEAAAADGSSISVVEAAVADGSSISVAEAAAAVDSALSETEPAAASNESAEGADGNTAAISTVEEDGSDVVTALTKVANVQFETTYIPEGMAKIEEGLIDVVDNPHHGGIDYFLYYMDEGFEEFEIDETSVISEEEISLPNVNGVYLELDRNFDKKIYLLYPDVSYVVELLAGDQVTKDELLKVADGIRLTPTDDESLAESAWKWSEYAAFLTAEETEEWTTEMDKNPAELIAVACQIGELFFCARDYHTLEVDDTIAVAVTDMQTADDLSLLPEGARGDENFDGMVDEKGTLLPDTISYVLAGDGVYALDNIVRTETQKRKLVYLTLEYENRGTEEADNILVFGVLRMIAGSGDDAEYYNLSDVEAGVYSVRDGMLDDYMAEMVWLDLDYAANGNGTNYIRSIAPGESCEVHIAFIVDEDQLPYLYLDMGSGDLIEPSAGIVDLRQSSPR